MEMLLRRRKKRKKNNQESEKKRKEELKVITATIDDVRKAVNDYALSLDKGISLRNVVLDNHELDYERLYDYLGGIPEKTFYMSKETYEIFEEEEYPKFIDMCQVACDQY